MSDETKFFLYKLFWSFVKASCKTHHYNKCYDCDQNNVFHKLGANGNFEYII